MKSQSIFSVLLVLAMTQLSACIEVRDKDNKPQEVAPMVEVQKFGDIVIDEAMYVYDGQILNAKDLDLAVKVNALSNKAVKQDFEFTFDRMTITQRGVLYTQGLNVRMHVMDFKSDGSIATFPEGQTARANVEGRSGGFIALDIANGEGVIKVILRGEKGGKGSDGNQQDAKLKGPHGADQLPPPNCSKNDITGKPGLQGYEGKNGRTGGNSGQLDLNIKGGEFTRYIQKIPGDGGDRGEGGLGGQGGDNGSRHPNCGPWFDVGLPQNNQGPNGPPGNPGVAGAQGREQEIHVTTSKGEFNY